MISETRKYSGIVLWLIIIGLFILSSCTSSHIYFVSPQGNDTNTGTKENPFLTLNAARDYIREQNHKSKVIIYLREGQFQLTETFELNENDAGSANAPIIFSAYENEKVSISGGVEIPAKAINKISKPQILNRLPISARENILEIDLEIFGNINPGEMKPVGFNRSVNPSPLEIFSETEAYKIAQWPNDYFVKFGKVTNSGSIPRNGDLTDIGGVFIFNHPKIHTWANAIKQGSKLWMSGFFFFGYADDMIQIESIDTLTNEITAKHPHLYGLSSKESRHGIFSIANLPEELDIPGEYVVMPEHQKILFYPASNYVDESVPLYVSMLEHPLFSLKNCSNVTIQNITFETSRGMGIYMEGGSNNVIDNCTFRNLGTVGICVGQGATEIKNLGIVGLSMANDTTVINKKHGINLKLESEQIGSLEALLYYNNAIDRHAGQNHIIKNCEFYNTGAGGIILGGGNRKELIPGNNLVENCYFHHLNRRYRSYNGAVNINGVGNIIRHCKIHDLAGAAIRLFGNGHLIEYNDISRVLLLGDHNGAIYMGRNPSEYDNRIQYNFFHEIHTNKASNNGVGPFSIHLDDGASGAKIFSNVFYNNEYEIRINGGKNNRIENNIFINSQSPKSEIWGGWSSEKYYKRITSDKLQVKRLIREVNILEQPYSTQYPELFKLYTDEPDVERVNYISNNILVNGPNLPKENNKLTNNLILNDSGNLYQIIDERFKLNNEAEMYQEIPDFQKIPFSRIGLIKQ